MADSFLQKNRNSIELNSKYKGLIEMLIIEDKIK